MRVLIGVTLPRIGSGIELTVARLRPSRRGDPLTRCRLVLIRSGLERMDYRLALTDSIPAVTERSTALIRRALALARYRLALTRSRLPLTHDGFGLTQ